MNYHRIHLVKNLKSQIGLRKILLTNSSNNVSRFFFYYKYYPYEKKIRYRVYVGDDEKIT